MLLFVCGLVHNRSVSFPFNIAQPVANTQDSNLERIGSDRQRIGKGVWEKDGGLRKLCARQNARFWALIQLTKYAKFESRYRVAI